MKHISNNISLSKEISDGDHKSLLLEDIITDDENKLNKIEDLMIDSENKNIILNAIKRLDKDEQFVIYHRYGINGAKIMLQKDIAKEINMSQANISKLERSSLKKLRLYLKSAINNQFF